MTDQARSIIIDFADKYLQPYMIKSKTSGDQLIPTLCPFCHGGSSGKDTNTFALSLEKGLFVCKRGSCGRHGRFSELAKEIAGEEIHLPSDGRHHSLRPSDINKEQDYVLPQIQINPPTDQIYNYFERRGISRETVDYFKIGSDASGMIILPFYDYGVLTFIKYRRPWKPTPDELRVKGKEWQIPDTKPILFNMDNIDIHEPVYITEGMIDAMALYEAGIHNVVSVPGGCSNMTWIQTCWDWLEKVDQFILFGDNDAPGREGVSKISKRLGEYRCKVITSYPEIPNGGGAQCKDADEILVRLGIFDLLETAESAEEIEVKGLIDVGDIIPVDPTTIPRISTKIPKLDYCIGGLMEGSCVVVSGESGQGKSTFVSQLILSSVEAGHTVCSYSGELPKEKFLLWLCYQAAGYEYIGLKYDKFLNKDVPFVSTEVQKRVQDYLRGKVFLYDNKETFTQSQAESIIELFTVAVKRHGASLLVADNMMSALCEEEEELKAQTAFINALKKFAEKYSVCVLVVCHPRKGKPGMPIGKWDVAGSANIVNLADAVIVVERPDIRVIKSRENGREDKIECCYEPTSRRIYQADRGDLNHFSWNRDGVAKPKVLASSLPEYQVQLSANKNTMMPAPF